MTSHKQIEKSLKRPDTFQETLLNALDFMKNNPKKIALMIAPLILVICGGLGFYLFQKSAAVKRRAELAAISAMQMDEARNVAKKIESIQKEIDALRKSPGSDPKKPELSAESLLKIGTLEKQLTELKPDHSGSAKAFRDFYDKNKKVTEGWMAGISWASFELENRRIADAKTILEEIVKSSTGHKFYQIQSRLMLANCLGEIGDFDNALKETDVLLGLVEDDAKAMALLLKGELLYFKKDAVNARTVLSELLEKHGSTREAQFARSLLAELGPA
jgi:predicted negative regulator of RcsB-dependent stress response